MEGLKWYHLPLLLGVMVYYRLKKLVLWVWEKAEEDWQDFKNRW